MTFRSKNLLLTMILLLGIFMPNHAQPRKLKVQWKKDLSLAALGGATSLSGYLLQRKLEPLTPLQINGLRQTDLNALDRTMHIQWRPGVARASDFVLLGTAALPFVLALHQGFGEEPLNLGLLSVQTFTYTVGLTSWTKYLIRRPRPFTYLPAGTDENLLKKQGEIDARISFFSGHTSVAATGSFLSAQLFSYYYPNSPYRPYVWIGAALLPAAVAYMRVRAGKHFPSDVMAGYLVGASVALINFRLHLDRP